MAEAEFGFHSFPRRGGGNDTLAMRILGSIAECGLLLTPEVIPVAEQLADGTRRTYCVQQKRCSFTVIPEQELASHSERFGPFSLAFEVEALRRLGGLPVAYIPRSDSAGEFSGLGATLVARLADVEGVLSHLIDGGNKVSGLPPGVSIEMLRDALRTYAGLLYPVDRSDDRQLEYFRQREWRILANVVGQAGPLTSALSEECTERVRSIDPEFFDRRIAVRSGDLARIALCQTLVSVGGKHPLEFAHHLVAPDEMVGPATKLLNQHGFNLAVRPLGGRV